MRYRPGRAMLVPTLEKEDMMMDGRTVRDVAAGIAAGAGVLLLADLALGWHSVSVTAVGVTAIETTASGWTDIGVVAGLATIAMLVYMIRPVRHAGSIDLVQAAVTAVLGAVVLGFTIAAAFTGTASVTSPAAAVEVSSRLWPVYAGIVLAGGVFAGTATAFVAVLRGATSPSPALNRTS